MRQKEAVGLYVGPAREPVSGLRQVLPRFAFDAAVLLALAVLLAAVTGLSRLPAALAALLLSGLLLCGCFAASDVLPRLRLLGLPLLAALLLVCLVLRGQMLNGFGVLWNGTRDLWASARGILLPMAAAEGQRGVWLAGCLLGCLLAVAGSLLVKYTPAVCAGLLMALAVAAGLLHASLWLAVPAAVSVLLLASGGSRSGSLAGLLSCAVLSALLAAVLALCLPAGAVESLAGQGRELMHHWRYERGTEVQPEGTLSAPLPEAEEETVLLHVTSDVTQTLYLRGFVGDTYEAECWRPLDGETAAGEKDLFYWLHQSGFYPQSQLALAARQMGGFETASVRIENLSACARYRYTPCGVVPETAGVKKAALQPSETTTDGWNGERTIACVTVTELPTLLPTLLEFLQTDTTEATAAYLQAESAYRAFVRSYALEVPAEFLAQMGTVLDACCAQYGGADALTREQAQVCALAFLERCFETEDHGTLPLDGTMPQTQYQYATVAALALRYYGIPARYAEGYVASVKANETAEITASCAGAWVEVYQDGVGWLPLELTPGLESLSAEQTEDGIKPVGAGAEGEGSGLHVTEGQMPQEDQTEQDNTREDNPKDGQRTGLLTRPSFWLALAGLLLLLLAAAIVLRRELIRRRRQREFDQADTSLACAALFSHTAALLETLGLCRAGGSMLELCPAAGEQLGEQYAAALGEMAMLNARALFSSHGVEDRLDEMRAFREQTLAELRARLRPLTRMKLKWLNCLY